MGNYSEHKLILKIDRRLNILRIMDVFNPLTWGITSAFKVISSDFITLKRTKTNSFKIPYLQAREQSF